MFGISAGFSGISQYFLVLIFVLTMIYLWSRRKNLPPGPWGIAPYIGYAPNFAYAIYQGEEVHAHLVKLARRYGKFYSFTVFGTPVVVLNDLSLIREAFQRITLNDRGSDKVLQKVFSPTVAKFSTMDPFRRFTLSTFRQFGIGTSGFEDAISKESTILIEELARIKDKPVDLTWYLNKAVTNIISKVVFGTRCELTDERIHHLTDLMCRLNALMGAGALDGLLPISFPSEEKRQLVHVGDEILQFIDEMIKDHHKNFDPDNVNDFIDVWLNELRLTKSSDDASSFLYSKNMTGLIHILYNGGTDTSSTTLRWGTQFLVKHHEVQARLHQELDEVVGRNRLPKLSDKPNLPYTEAFILELHRTISLIPLSVAHVASEDTLIHGYTIPKNSIVMSNLYAVMHDPDVWTDPEVFRPERFLDANGELCPREEVIPFGVGRRNCLGEALAKQELFIFFTHLLHQFSFDRPYEGAPLPTLKPIYGIVNHPETYKMRVVKRD